MCYFFVHLIKLHLKLCNNSIFYYSCIRIIIVECRFYTIRWDGDYMSFSSQTSCLITDSYSNIYNFSWDKDEIVFMYFDKILQKAKRKVLVEQCTLEFDATIDKDDNIYLVCQNKMGLILLLSYDGGAWNVTSLEDSKEEVFNFNILKIGDKIHIIYCKSVERDKRTYKIIHKIMEGEDSRSTEICEIKTREILNPVQVIKHHNKLIMGYYNLVDQTEQLFFRIYHINKEVWDESKQLTFTNNYKLYLDILEGENNDFHITYSQYLNGNLVIKYEKHKIEDSNNEKLFEKIISNPGNCSYPTFIINEDKLWNVWTEYNSVVSSFSHDGGKTWSSPYLWKKTKHMDFLRYKFVSNNVKLKQKYRLNYSFGNIYPNISLIGFGPLDNVEEIQLKSHDKDDILKKEVVNINRDKIKENINNNGSDNMNVENLKTDIKALDARIKKIEELYDEIEKVKKVKDYFFESKDMKKIQEGAQRLEKLFKEVDELKEFKTQLEQSIDPEDLKKLEERIDQIEKYITRRRRGPLFGPR